MRNIKQVKKRYLWAAVYTLALLSFSAFVILDTFVVPHIDTPVSSAAVETLPESTSDTSDDIADEAANSSTETEAIVSDSYYEDENIKITIETQYVYDSMVYIADIEVSDVSYLKTAFADGTYGRNITETTSEIAQESGAVFAVNGDYYGFRNYGYVLRNGILYRDNGEDTEDLVIDENGDFTIINEEDTDAQSLEDEGVWQVLSFGPALINNGEITVDETSEVSKAKSSNPRTAIGQVSPLHYIVIVADGRTDESAGLSLLELAQLFDDYGCTVAYNLDGGGSSTMWFCGEVINNPTSGRSYGERSVSDIVYFG